MNKILKYFKRRILCINSRTDREMVNLTQCSSRVTRSKSKKQENVDPECQHTRADDDSQKKTRSFARQKPKKKNKTKPPELNSLRASRGSLGTVSLAQTPKPSQPFSLPLPTTPKHLQPPHNPSLRLTSPPIATISADTPERSHHFHSHIANVADCRLRVLGKGSFGTIIQANYKGELVAAKIVPPQKAASLKNELNNFLLSHPNIVRTLRIISSEENHSCGLVIMEMYSSITLEHLSNEESYCLDEKRIVRFVGGNVEWFMADIASALDHCHNQRVLHLDVKPQNILVNVTTNVCKLCDFGSSSLYLGEEAFTESPDYKILQSTVVYTSPELLAGGCPTDKSDVYSFGITMWQLVHREKPYVVDNKIDLQSTIYKIVKQGKRPQEKEAGGILGKLYARCWDHEPEKRPSMKEIVEYLESAAL